MTRKCSHCSHNGHNSRTCPNKGVKLFGVRLTDGSSSIRKSVSMGNLSHYAAAAGGGASPAEGGDHGADVADGYASEDFVAGSSSGSRERKRGVPWTEEEHRMFLLGLQKLGKGDWRGIARTFVKTRTPTQVASHAQKFFIRQTNMGRRKRRSSLFDIVPDEAADSQFLPMNDQDHELIGNGSVPVPQTVDEECESMDSNNSLDGEPNAPKQEAPQSVYPFIYPTFFTPVLPYPVPVWAGYNNNSSETAAEAQTHEVVKPIPVHSKTPINVDELLGMSRLSIDESNADASTLTKMMLADSNRQSAFHAKASMKPSASQIHAVQ